MISPETRDLAHRLLTYEASAVKSSVPMEYPTLRTYEKLRQCLAALTGVVGFQSIAVRALVLAQREDSNLSSVRVNAEGVLQGLDEVEHPGNVEQGPVGIQHAHKDAVGEAGVILIAHILGLLIVFLGEALTLSLLRNAWPDATFDDRTSGNGR